MLHLSDGSSFVLRNHATRGQTVTSLHSSDSALEADHFEQMKLKAENTSQFLEEVSILAGVRFLEDGRIVSPSTADEMAREAIANIRANHSERIGKILESVNDAYLRDRR